MAFNFPTVPADGTLLTLNGKTYSYVAADNRWDGFGGGVSGASTIQPTAPINGQLWYDTASGLLKVWNASTGLWETAGGAVVSTVAPTSPALGDFWFNNVSGVLSVWGGGSWISSDSYMDFQTGTGATPTLRDDGVTALAEGDWWYDNSPTVPKLHFWDGGQWLSTTDGGAF